MGRQKLRRHGIIAGLFLILGQDGLDPDDGVEDIGAGVALEGGEPIHIKGIVLGGQVGKVAVFQGRHCNDARNLVHCVAGDDVVLQDPLLDGIGNLGDQILQPHHTAGTGLKGLAVLAVHGAEAQELKLGAFGHNMGLLCGAEYLLKVQGLPLVHHVEHLVGMIVLLPLYQSCKVGGGIEGCAVGLQNNAGRNLRLILGLLDTHHQRALALYRIAAVFQVLHHVGDIGLRVAFALPQVEFHVEVLVVLLQVGHGYIHHVMPDCHIAPIALLELEGCLMGPGRERRILLALCGSGRINLLQFRDGKGRLGGILALEIRVKIGKLGLTLPNALNDQAHLEAPVAQVHVANDLVAHIPLNALDRLADDGGTDMAHVQGLCHIGSAVVDDHGFGLFLALEAEFLCHSHFLKIIRHIFRCQPQIDKSGLHRLHRQEGRVALELRHGLLRNLNGGFMILLGSLHAAVALIFTQIRARRYADPSKLRRITGLLKRSGYLPGDQINEFFHSSVFLSQ